MDEATRALFQQLGYMTGTQEQVLASLASLHSKVDALSSARVDDATRISGLEMQMGFVKRWAAPLVFVGSMVGGAVASWLGLRPG